MKKSPLRPSHTTTETEKRVVIIYTHYNFFSLLQRFFNSFIYGQRFLQRFSQRFF